MDLYCDHPVLIIDSIRKKKSTSTYNRKSTYNRNLRVHVFFTFPCTNMIYEASHCALDCKRKRDRAIHYTGIYYYIPYQKAQQLQTFTAAREQWRAVWCQQSSVSLQTRSRTDHLYQYPLSAIGRTLWHLKKKTADATQLSLNWCHLTEKMGLI